MLEEQSSPDVTKSGTISLATSLEANIPSCAQECVSTFISEYFIPSPCTNATDVSCLCTNYSTSGFTLGEASLACLNSNCSGSALNDASEVYNICSGQTGAVTATHSVLTLFETTTFSTSTVSTSSKAVPMTSSAATTSSTSSTSLQSTQAASPAMASTPSMTTIAYSTRSSNIPTPTSAIASTATTSATVSGQSSGLTSAQAVGVSVGAFAILGIFAGIVLCFVCLRRKRAKQKHTKPRHSFDFVDRLPSPCSPVIHVVQGPRGPMSLILGHEDSAQHHTAGYTTSGTRTTLSLSHPDNQQNRITPLKQRKTSSPVRTTQLPPPILTRSNTPKRPPRPESTATVNTTFEEDLRSPRIPSAPKPLPELPALPEIASLSIRKGQAQQPRSNIRGNNPPNAIRQSSLSLEIPSNLSQDGRLPSPTDLAPDNPWRHMPQSARMSAPPNSAMSYLPAYYTSDDSRTPATTIRSPMSQRFSHPHIVPPLPSRSSRYSMASVTTFESVDPNEATPPEEEDKQFSPVAESPIAGLRYPKVPRPSNQAVPRISPKSVRSQSYLPTYMPKTPPDKQTTLIAKRRRNAVAQDLERRFRGDSPVQHSGSQPSDAETHPLSNLPGFQSTPLGNNGKDTQGPNACRQGYGNESTPKMALKSPLWEPKLTPSRRGGDLFISVR